ncbi:MAG: exonuclease domain-containing protein, partial [Candidatus Limnocylindrus sp.]
FHADIVAANPHNHRMILPEPRDRFRGTLPKRWVALDFETTGIWKKDPDVAVIEIGLITFERDREVDAWSTLVNSGTPVSDFIAELTGITQSMVDRDGVDVDEAGDALAERLAGAELVIAHNMSFDAEGLQWLGIELGRDQHTFCTMRGLTAPDQKWPRLEEVVKEFQIKVEGQAHRAESDARTAGRVFIEMVRRGY